MFVFVVYVPESHLDAVKQAMFAAGAGSIGDYSQCAWQVLGTGQFCPGVNADPFIGENQQVTQVAEYRLEMVCQEDIKNDVLAALRASHPYEEPAFHVLVSEV